MICDDFDLCADCSSVSATTHARDHSFYRIQYRNLTIPPVDGEDYDMLCRFRDTDDSENFYMHYPWFFSSEIVDRLLTGMSREEIHRSALQPLDNISQDQYIRTIMDEDWNWRAVKEHVSCVIDLQVTRARYSQPFHSLFQNLRGQQWKWADCQKESTVQVAGPDLNTQLHSEKLNLTELRAATEIFRRYRTAQQEDWKTGWRGVIVGKFSNRLKYLHQIVTQAHVRNPRSGREDLKR
jgi:hypothetical protein